MKKKGLTWISFFASAVLFLTTAAPALAQEYEAVPEIVQEDLQEADTSEESVSGADIVIAAEEPVESVAEGAESVTNEEYAESSAAGDLDFMTEEPVESAGAEVPETAVEVSEETVPAVISGMNEEITAVSTNTAETTETEQPEDADEEEAVETEAEEELQQADEEVPVVSYRTHVQTYGWETEWKENGAVSGTVGQSKRLEGINIKVDGVEGLGISYCTHVQSIGWQNYVSDGEMAGTEGQAKRLEAIQMYLTGERASEYDVYYCVHVQTYGWLNWAKNNEMAGTSGYSKRLEGICIKIQKKGEEAPAALGTRSVASLHGGVAYQTHVQSIGWQGYVKDSAVSGTTGQAKRLEGIRIRFGDQPLAGFIQYKTHIQGIGWESGWRGTDMMSGTEGQSRRLEAIRIKLYGEIEKEYDIWYRTHVQKYGWTGWAQNGTPCGSEGIAYRMEAIQIKLLPKGSAAPGSTDHLLYTETVEEALGGALMVKAYNYVNSITNAAMTNEQKLRICFDSFANFQEILVYYPVYTASDWPQVYANHFFDTWSGDCLTYASAFAYMAKVIGYSNVYALNSTGHGWAEINGLIYDPEFSLHSYEMYGLPYSAVPAYQNVRDLAGPGNTYRMEI